MKKILSVLFLLIPLLLCAQSLEQSLEKPSKLYVGTPFKLHIKITSALEDSIFAPRYDSLDVFFLNGDPQQYDVIEKSSRITNVTLTFQAFDTGEYTFPPLEFLVKNNDKTQKLSTKEFPVTVHSVLPDTAQVIRDIAAPVKLKLGFWDYFIPAVVIIVLILFFIQLSRYFSKSKAKEIPQKKIDTRPAWLKALDLLKGIDFRGLLNSGQFVEYYYQLSLVLRYYLEKKYHFNALEMTTSEIRIALKKVNPPDKSGIIKLLEESDKVKFAKFIPQPDNADALLTWLRNYLQSVAAEKDHA